MKKLIAMVSLLIVLVLTGCGTKPPSATAEAGNADAIDAIQQKGELVVATNATDAASLPFAFMDGDNIVGVDIEIARAISDKLDVTLRIENMPIDQMIAAVPEGKADLCMRMKPDQPDKMDFSATYFENTVALLVLKDNETIKTADDLKGKKTGVQLGTSADIMAAPLIAGADVVRKDKDTECIQDLIDGKLDAVLLDIGAAQTYAAQNADTIKLIDASIMDEKYAIAVKKDDQELLNTVNEVVKELKDSGKLAQILQKYGITN